MIYEYHRKTPENIGDYICNPSRYFDIPKVKSFELCRQKYPVENQIAIVGGGGLIHKKFQLYIQKIISQNPKHLVLWGLGHNFSKKHIMKTSHNVYYPEWINSASLIGIRDYIKDYEKFYLPCVTCMHDAFDKKYEVSNEVVFYIHAQKSSFVAKEGQIFLKNNEKDMNKIIKFLASAETIVTDSFHGAYWAQLLGKNVKAINWSVKFQHLKYQPTFIDNLHNWQSPNSYVASDYLEECRSLNNNFYHNFLNLL